MNFRPTPGLADSDGCLCAPTSPAAFAPGSTASFDSKKAERQRIVKQSGAPAILRMGRMHKFLRGLGQEETSYADYPNTLVEPTPAFIPNPDQFLNPGFLFPQLPIETTSSALPATLQPPASVATLTPSSSNVAAITSLINAGTSAAKTLTAPTATMTPAQIAALSAASRTTPGSASWLAKSSVIPGLSNQNVLLYGALGALLLAMGMKK